MEVPHRKENFDSEFVEWLNLFDDLADAVSKCHEADFSAAWPSESNPDSAQFLAWKFGQIVASYALRDQEWRDNLFCEGEFVIESKPTRIWPWTDIWSSSGRLVPLVVGSLLSDYEKDRDWKLLREHYLQMWSGSYTSWGKPLSEVCPEDDLYWAMRIGFADRMLREGQSNVLIRFAEEALERKQSIEPPPDVLADISALKERLAELEDERSKDRQRLDEKLDKLFQALPPTTPKIRSRLQQHLGGVAAVMHSDVLMHCVQAEQYYENGTMQAPAIVSFAKAVEASLNHCLVNSLIDYVKKHEQKYMTICFPPPRGAKKKSIYALSKLSLAEWADILYMLSVPRGKSLSDLGIWELMKFMEEHLGGKRLPDFRPLSEPLHKIQQYRNRAAHYSTGWEEPQQDLEVTRSLVLGTGGQTPVIVEISRLLAPRTAPDLTSPGQALPE